jgi:hypothetical protein
MRASEASRHLHRKGASVPSQNDAPAVHMDEVEVLWRIQHGQQPFHLNADGSVSVCVWRGGLINKNSHHQFRFGPRRLLHIP